MTPTPRTPMNPWLANAVVFSGFLIMMATSFGIYWWWTGGGDRMVAAVHRSPLPDTSEIDPTPTIIDGPKTPSSVAVTPTGAHLDRWAEYRRRLANGERVDPVPLYLADLEEEEAEIRLAAVRALAPLQDPRARAAIELIGREDLDAEVRQAALTRAP